MNKDKDNEVNMIEMLPYFALTGYIVGIVGVIIHFRELWMPTLFPDRFSPGWPSGLTLSLVLFGWGLFIAANLLKYTNQLLDNRDKHLNEMKILQAEQAAIKERRHQEILAAIRETNQPRKPGL